MSLEGFNQSINIAIQDPREHHVLSHPRERDLEEGQ